MKKIRIYIDTSALFSLTLWLLKWSMRLRRFG
jgi:hypothetical protein